MVLVLKKSNVCLLFVRTQYLLQTEWFTSKSASLVYIRWLFQISKVSKSDQWFALQHLDLLMILKYYTKITQSICTAQILGGCFKDFCLYMMNEWNHMKWNGMTWNGMEWVNASKGVLRLDLYHWKSNQQNIYRGRKPPPSSQERTSVPSGHESNWGQHRIVKTWGLSLGEKPWPFESNMSFLRRRKAQNEKVETFFRQEWAAVEEIMFLVRFLLISTCSSLNKFLCFGVEEK